MPLLCAGECGRKTKRSMFLYWFRGLCWRQGGKAATRVVVAELHQWQLADEAHKHPSYGASPPLGGTNRPPPFYRTEQKKKSEASTC